MPFRSNRRPQRVNVSAYLLTVIPSLVSGCVAELQVYVPVLTRFSPALAVGGSLVGLVVDITPKGMGELLSAAAALFTQIMAFSEMFTKVMIIAAKKIPSSEGPLWILFDYCIEPLQPFNWVNSLNNKG